MPRIRDLGINAIPSREVEQCPASSCRPPTAEPPGCPNSSCKPPTAPPKAQYDLGSDAADQLRQQLNQAIGVQFI